MCHGNHPSILCPHRSARRELSPSPSQSKGVTPFARPPLLANSAVYSFDSVLVGSRDNFSDLELRSPFFYLHSSRVCQCKFWLLLRSPAVCLLRPVSQLTRINVDKFQREPRHYPNPDKVAYVVQGLHLHFTL